MRAVCLVLSAILIAVYHYKHGYVRGWSLMRQGKKKKKSVVAVVEKSCLLFYGFKIQYAV